MPDALDLLIEAGVLGIDGPQSLPLLHGLVQIARMFGDLRRLGDRSHPSLQFVDALQLLPVIGIVRIPKGSLFQDLDLAVQAGLPSQPRFHFGAKRSLFFAAAYFRSPT